MEKSGSVTGDLVALRDPTGPASSRTVIDDAPPSVRSGPLGELATGWKALVGCMIGIAIGVISIPVVTLSLFMAGFQHDFGWTRTEVSGAYTVLLVVVLLTSPVVGIICDRINPRNVVLFSHVALGLAFLAFSRLGGNISHFILGYGMMALIASGASTVAFARVISANFVQARGFALGVGMSGFGITSLLMPLVLTPYITEHGWRNSFIALGITVLVVAPLVYALLPSAARGLRQRSQLEPQADIAGFTFGEALRSPIFWTLGIAFALISLGISGINVHFVSMMTDIGMSPVRAGAIASGIGASTIVIRLLTGWLLDRFDAHVVATGMVIAAAACLFAFAMDARFALAGAIAYGLGIGSEIDIVGYLTARHFGMRAYGKIYGMLYAEVLLGSSLSPMLYGLIFQRTGGYFLALVGASLCLAFAAVLIIRMPRTSGLAGIQTEHAS